jgi:hypothetical protein
MYASALAIPSQLFLSLDKTNLATSTIITPWSAYCRQPGASTPLPSSFAPATQDLRREEEFYISFEIRQ